MPYQSNSKIITNRQLNFTLGPIDTHNKKEMPYKADGFEIDGTWNHHQSIILDVLLDHYFRSFYTTGKKLPQSWRSKKVVSVMAARSKLFNRENLRFLSMPPFESYQDYIGSDLLGDLKEDYERYKVNNKHSEKHISFDEYIDNYLLNNRDYQYYINSQNEKISIFYSDLIKTYDIASLFDHYAILSKYKYTLTKYLDKIAQTKFKMMYKVKYIEQLPTYNSNGKIVGRGKTSDMYYQMQNFEHLFELSFTESNIELNFNTPLGKFVLHNMQILDTDWFPVEAVSLSKNAYYIYKRYIMSKRNGKYKSKKIELNFDDIKTYLDLNWSNPPGVHGIIVKALNNLIQNGYMARFEYNKHRVGQRHYILYFE